jgi:hypothetical protein
MSTATRDLNTSSPELNDTTHRNMDDALPVLQYPQLLPKVLAVPTDNFIIPSMPTHTPTMSLNIEEARRMGYRAGYKQGAEDTNHLTSSELAHLSNMIFNTVSRFP